MATQTTQNKLRTYETIIITKVDMPDDKFAALVDRCKNAVTGEGKGEWLIQDDWGRAKIAFTIGKDNRGRWTYLRYKSIPGGTDEVQRSLRINEFVLRQQTVRANEDGKDYESLRETMVQELATRGERPQREWREDRGERRGGRREFGDRNSHYDEGGGDEYPPGHGGMNDSGDDL